LQVASRHKPDKEMGIREKRGSEVERKKQENGKEGGKRKR